MPAEAAPASVTPPGSGSGSSGLFAQFPIVGVERIVKRTLYSAIGVGVVGAAAAILLGHPLVAPGLLIGLALALANHRVFQSSALRFISPDGAVNRKPFAGAVFLRLGAVTVITILALVFVRPVGWGIIGGLAVFQFLMLINGLVALLRYQQQQIGGPNGAGGSPAGGDDA